MLALHVKFIDHIAPLASTLGIPVYLLSEEERLEDFKRWYPKTQFFHLPKDPQQVIEVFSSVKALLYANYFRLGLEEWIEALGAKERLKHLRLIHLPHGTSDKGKTIWWLERFLEEDITLISGEKMSSLLKKKGIWDSLYQPFFLGNVRKSYYEEHRSYYKKLIKKEILSRFPEEKPYYLYAPTWFDREDSSSLRDSLRFLNKAPKGQNILLKLHPNIRRKNPAFFFYLQDSLSKNPYVQVLEDFPLIYPLLREASLYIGDASSVGYDALACHLPIFLLEREKREKDFPEGCATYIPLNSYEKAFSIIEKTIFSKKEELMNNCKREEKAIFSEARSPSDLIKELSFSIEKKERISLEEVQKKMELFKKRKKALIK